MDVTVEEFDPVDPSREALLAAAIVVGEAASRAEYGDWHTAWSADEIRARFRDQRDARRFAWAGTVDGLVVGQAELLLPDADNQHRCTIEVTVHPDYRRRGIGTALLTTAERVARHEARNVLGSMSDVAVGHVDQAKGFAARHGYTAELVELRSDLVLPVADGVLDAALAEAEGRASDYEVMTSWDGIPDEWLNDRAELSRRMSTDAPKGGVDLAEESWDAQRVRRTFELARDQGRRVVESVVRHSPSGRLVGFTTLAVAAHTPHLAYQWDTLVLREHRGHRLGLLLKVVNLRALIAGLPEVRRVVTFNAEENAPMLRVNRLLGFAVAGRLTEWQKRLA